MATTGRGVAVSGTGGVASGRGWDIIGMGGVTPGRGGALVLTEEEEGSESTRLANEAAGPPFSHSRLLGPAPGFMGPALSPLAPPPFASETARRASRRRVFRVSRLK